MFDAADPPSSPYPGCQAVAGYIGGNTPHVWTAAEWQRFGHLRQFPIWTGYAEANPAHHGQQAVAAMRARGWAAGRPDRRAVIVDEETEVNAAWIDAFAAVVWAARLPDVHLRVARHGPRQPAEGGLPDRGLE